MIEARIYQNKVIYNRDFETLSEIAIEVNKRKQVIQIRSDLWLQFLINPTSNALRGFRFDRIRFIDMIPKPELQLDAMTRLNNGGELFILSEKEYVFKRKRKRK